MLKEIICLFVCLAAAQALVVVPGVFGPQVVRNRDFIRLAGGAPIVHPFGFGLGHRDTILFGKREAKEDTDFPIKAVALIVGNINTTTLIMGEVFFEQKEFNSSVVISANITFSSPMPVSEYGFHVHQFGISVGAMDAGVRCASAGGHFNPINSTVPHVHGSKHLGDLQSLVLKKETEKETIISTVFENDKLSLCGENSIIGRSIVIHLPKIGDAMPVRIACGDIVRFNEFFVSQMI